MGWLSIVLLLYAILNMAMGILGYANAHSIASLVAGVASGALVLAGAAWAKTNPKGGYILCGVVALLILGRFFKGFVVDHKVYPAGILVIASVLTLIALGVGHMQDSKAAPANGDQQTSQNS